MQKNNGSIVSISDLELLQGSLEYIRFNHGARQYCGRTLDGIWGKYHLINLPLLLYVE